MIGIFYILHVYMYIYVSAHTYIHIQYVFIHEKKNVLNSDEKITDH